MSDSSHSFEAYYKRATSPLVVLKLLLDGPMYGYEMSQELKRRSKGRFTIALLYPVLYRLEEQGYIKVVRSEVVNNRARSYYGVTQAGRNYLTSSFQEYQEIHAAFLDIMEGDEA